MRSVIAGSHRMWFVTKGNLGSLKIIFQFYSDDALTKEEALGSCSFIEHFYSIQLDCVWSSP